MENSCFKSIHKVLRNITPFSGKSIGITLVTSFLVVLCFTIIIQAQIDLAAQKRIWTETLDSLDLEKQIHKRKGESIGELEKQSENIKDSITALRKQVEFDTVKVASIKSTIKPVQHKESFFDPILKVIQTYLPKTFFDWLVVCVALVAAICGIVLVFGIIGMISKKIRKKKVPAKPRQDVFPPSYAADAYSRIPKVSPALTEDTIESVSRLRQRIEGDSLPVSQKEKKVPWADSDSSEAKPPIKADFMPRTDGARMGYEDAPERVDKKTTSADSKNKVIRAAKEGLDVSEISRRLHMSVDQVSLILRIARKKDRT